MMSRCFTLQANFPFQRHNTLVLDCVSALKCFDVPFDRRPARFSTDPSQLVVGDGARVHEGLRDDGQNGVHVIRVLHVENELRVLEDVDPEAQRQTGEEGRKQTQFGDSM